MRPLRKPQMGLFFQRPEHKLGHELKKISESLDRHPQFVDLAHKNLVAGVQITGNL